MQARIVSVCVVCACVCVCVCVVCVCVCGVCVSVCVCGVCVCVCVCVCTISRDVFRTSLITFNPIPAFRQIFTAQTHINKVSFTGF